MLETRGRPSMDRIRHRHIELERSPPMCSCPGWRRMDGATSLVRRIWHLPGAISNLIVNLGSELLRREADRLAAFTGAKALGRVRATHE